MTRHALNRVALAAVLAASSLASACGGGGSIEGTYESGISRLTIHGAGKATFRLAKTNFDCTYTENDTSLTLKCPARDPANITFNDDGSLVDPFVGTMKRID